MKQCAEVSAITPLLTVLRRNIHSFEHSIFIAGANTFTDSLGETWGKRVEPMLFVEIQDSKTTDILAIYVILLPNKSFVST